MKKLTLLSTMMLIALALVVAPYTALACDGSGKAGKTSADASMINSEAAEMDKAKVTKATAGTKDCPAMSKRSACTDKGVKMTKSDGQTEANFATATFSVNGMTCGGCEKALNGKLTGTDGVNEVLVVCHKSNKAVLTYDPQKISTNDLAEAITKMGYEAKYVSETETDKEKM